jgi:hypothetical protein
MSFIETPDGLAYTEAPTPWHLRLCFVGFGALAFLIPYPFLLHADWSSATASTLGAAVGVVAPPVLGLLFIGLGMARPQQLRFNGRRRELERSGRRPWGSRHETLAFDRVERVDVVRQPHREAADDLFEVVLTLSGRRPIRLGAYDGRDEAEHWAGRVRAALGHDRGGRPDHQVAA